MWTLPLNNQLTTHPAYDDSHAFIALDSNVMVGYDLWSGVRLWTVPAEPVSQPTAGGGLVFWVERTALVARRAADGAAVWRLPYTETLAAPPVWDNGWLILATPKGSILAYRATDGHLVWRRELGSPAHASPALAADRVYVPLTDGRVVALSVETGAPVWERRLGGTPNDLVALQQRLYVGSKDNFLYCLMTDDGRVDWRWPTGGDIVGMPIVDEHRVYFASLDNVLRALDLKSGTQQWMRALPLRPAWGPVKAGETIVVGGQLATLKLFKVEDGTVAGDVPAGADVAAPPFATVDPANGLPTLFVLTADIAKGATARSFARNIEPVIAPIAPLPNLITMTPTPTVAAPR